jgi:hypothetical protein
MVHTLRHFRLSVLFLAALCTSACTLKLISDYDSLTDSAVTAFQTKAETLLLDIENSPKDPYSNYQARYVELKADLSAILLRAESIDLNNITIAQVKLLQDQIGLLEEAHKGGISKEEVPAFRTAIEVPCLAILKLERAKQRGKN